MNQARRNERGLLGNGGQFAPLTRPEAKHGLLDDEHPEPDAATNTGSAWDGTFIRGYLNDQDAWVVGDEGECLNCGHLMAFGETCESCSPTCTECGTRLESADMSLCEHCQDKEDEADAYGDQDDDDGW